ncbi:Siderophore biosynthesis regulatory protein URBS1 [Ceratobasidium theobromae]|uniref:Siderophore biosynthesis regulatory protein URBS1 n=1 Tax=Ceratobasidium theobromae TaxID=1582974 RepID=A0A5N5QQY2_9AGAM|nr:Siderophore biosynthesis regulatory protein URBS1 [Ceratobasidium theobromae]
MAVSGGELMWLKTRFWRGSNLRLEDRPEHGEKAGRLPRECHGPFAWAIKTRFISDEHAIWAIADDETWWVSHVRKITRSRLSLTWNVGLSQGRRAHMPLRYDIGSQVFRAISHKLPASIVPQLMRSTTMASASPPPTHARLPHPLNRSPQYHPLPRTLPAPPSSKHSDAQALDAAIAQAADTLDIANTGLLNDLVDRLASPALYTRPATRKLIVQLLEVRLCDVFFASDMSQVASDEIAKTRAAGLWEITARVAQERHFVCPPQMEGTVKSYIKMVDTVNENSGAFDEDDLKARLARINQSKPFQANIPANTACLFCRRRKIKCDGSLPQCDMCVKHRQAKCEYPQKSHYGGFSNRGGLHYVVPMGPDIAAAAASSANGAPPPMLLELGKAVKGYAPAAPSGAPYILPGPAPYRKSWEEDEEERPGSSSTSSQPLRADDGPGEGHERCINCDTDKTSLWRKDEDGRTICNACQIYFRVHGRKRPPSMRSSTVKKRPGRQPRPSAGHTLPPDEDRAMNSPRSSRSRSPADYATHLRAIEHAIARGQRSQPPATPGLDYALSRHHDGYRGRADYVAQDRPISPEARNSYNRDIRAPLHPSPSVDTPMADDRHRQRRPSDDHRRILDDDDETEVQAGENLCAVEGGRSPADVLVFRFDADRAKSVCATHSVEDDLRFHLNCYRKNPPDSGSQERVTLGVATDWLPKAGVYSITSGDEPPTSHHMAPPPNGKLNQTIDITSEIREGLNTLKFTQLRDMSDCVLVVQIWKVGRKSSAPQPPPSARYASAVSPVDKHHSRAPAPVSSRGPAVYEASPSPGGLGPRGMSPGRNSRPKIDSKSNGRPWPSCLYCQNNRITCRQSLQENLGCEECLRRGIQCVLPEDYSPDMGYHATPNDRKPALHSPPSQMSSSNSLSAPLSPGGSSTGSKRKPVEDPAKSKRSHKRRAGESTPPPSTTLPPMHHIQHVPPAPPGYPPLASLPAPSSGRSSGTDSRANQDLRRHHEMLIKQQQDAERENARVLAGGLPTPYA